MLGNILGSLVGPNSIAPYIQRTLAKIAEEKNLKHNEVFITIRPTDAEFNFKMYACTYDEKGNPRAIRQVTLEEVLNNKE